jgi:1-acyl-sn-glycerol-3-phosphate acyltransferase
LAKGWWKVRFVFPGTSLATRQASVRQWAQQMLAAMGLSLRTSGPQRVSGPVLLVCNHISWIDILALMATGSCRFVSKAQIHRWPVVGTLAAGADTLFIERESSRDAMRVMHRMAQALQEGDTVAVFPEGTTSTGESVMPFHANLFQAAVASQAPVQPIALAYFDGDGTHCSSKVAFVGDDNLLQSLRGVLMSHELSIQVSCGPVLRPEGQGRRQWALTAHQQVNLLHADLIGRPADTPVPSQGQLLGWTKGR